MSESSLRRPPAIRSKTIPLTQGQRVSRLTTPCLVFCYGLVLSGGIASILLLLWGQYSTTSRLPDRIWWTGIVIGFISACFISWRDERRRADGLETDRPLFKPEYTGFEQGKRTDGTLTDKFVTRFLFRNIRAIPARHMSRRIVLTDDLGMQPLYEGESANANDVFDVFNLRGPVNIPKNAPAHYFYVQINYEDSRPPHHKYSQDFCYVWPGSDTTEFDMFFRDATADVGAKIRAYVDAVGTKQLAPRKILPESSDGKRTSQV